MSITPRRLLGVAVNVLWLAAAITAATVLWPSSMGGCTTLTIVSGHSMEPTYFTGDLVVSRCGDSHVGDVIVYTPPDVGGARVIHRIIGGDETQGWLVQGDNNDFIDPWTPTPDMVLGTSVLHVPELGKYLSVFMSPLVWVFVMVLGGACLLWPPASPDPTDDTLEETP